MDWEIISDELEVEPLVKKHEQLKLPENLQKNAMLPSRKKIFRPTPSPAPLEKDEVESEPELELELEPEPEPEPESESESEPESESDSESLDSIKKPISSKKSALIPFICVGFVMYLLSEYSKNSVIEKSL